LNRIVNGLKELLSRGLTTKPRDLDRLSDRAAIVQLYHQKIETRLNLKVPKTFNEKINWRKLYQHDPRFTTYADKIAVKALVAEQIGEDHIIETLWAGKDPADIPFERLDPPFVIKVNHGSGEHIFVHSESDIDESAIINSMTTLLRISHAHRFREWGYQDIPPQVLVERMIRIPGHGMPDDYKFFVYHGKVHYIQLDQDRYGAHRQNFYTPEWAPLNVRYVAPAGETVAKPKELDEMIRLAEALGAPFDFVRVDLYSTSDGIKFGEFTFYPNAGLVKFEPAEWDQKFGEPWRLPERRGKKHVKVRA
jgi:hypothetical protein